MMLAVRLSLLVAAPAALVAAGFTLDGSDVRLPESVPYGLRLEHPLQLVQPALIDTSGAAGGFTVGVTPQLINDGDMVTITVTSANPTSSDWVAAYTPWPVQDLTTVMPTKYQWLDYDAGYMASGQSRLRFQLPNMRGAFGFVVFTGGLRRPVVGAIASDNVTFVDPNAPLRPRVVPTGNPDSVRVLWSSINASEPVVRWWPAGGSNASAAVVSATPKWLTRSMMCQAPATGIGWFDLGTHYEALVAGLLPYAGQRISYLYGDAARGVYGAPATLRIPTAPGDTVAPTRIIAYQDMGRGSTDDAYSWDEFTSPAINTTKWVAQDVSPAADKGYGVIASAGDLSYAMGFLNVWDLYLFMLAPVASALPYAVGVGNHESDSPFSADAAPGTHSYYNNTDSGGECSQAAAFILPMGGNASANAPWWSMDTGLVHLITLSSEHEFRRGSPQWLWLQADLQAVNRSVTPWVILGIHRPLYIDSTWGPTNGLFPASDQDAAQAMRPELEPLLFAYRVNLAIYGHNHVYQRLSAAYGGNLVQRSVPQAYGPAWKGPHELRDDATATAATGAAASAGPDTIWVQNNPQATVHMVVGSAGASFSLNTQPVAPAWAELVLNAFGYSRIHAINASLLTFEFVASIDGSVVDRMAIVQPDPSASWGAPPGSTPDDGGLRGAPLVAVIAGSMVGCAVLVGIFRASAGVWPTPAGFKALRSRRAGARSGVSVGAGGAQYMSMADASLAPATAAPEVAEGDTA
jgi:hypothetical protein